jgi:hypothetical protein
MGCFQGGGRNKISLHSVQIISEAHLATYSGAKAVVSPRIEGSGRKVDHSRSSDKVKSDWNCASTPPHAFEERIGTILQYSSTKFCFSDTRHRRL